MILDELADHARERVSKDKVDISLEEMKKQALSLPKGNFLFEKSLEKGMAEKGCAIISEVKKASPSKGVISPDFPYLDIAKSYEAIGCHCMSVLTEPKWFLGSDEIFREIRAKSTLPMIRKDFTIDEYQIYQAKTMGADAVLLICALLDTETIVKYLEICDTLGISALVETHDEEELASAQKAGARIIGVNNRNLKDFSVNLNNASDLRKKLSTDVIFVAESGITCSKDGVDLVKSGANALLIGEALMRSTNKEAFVTEIFQGVLS
ncbi:MAG: indole-3-glycerol phosphate synthase TrpC [Eubacteriales bacterium]